MIYYFSGTGNSRFIAQEIAALTNDCVCSMSEKEPIPTDENGAFLGIVFPVYGWQPPKIVRRFCATLDAASAKGRFVYIIMTCGTDTGKTLDILRRQMQNQGIAINSAYSVIMPDSYVCLPGFEVDKEELRKRKFSKAAKRIYEIAADIKDKRMRTDVFEGALPRTKSYILGNLFYKFLVKDKPFNVNSKCTGCGICQKACPVGNVILSDGLPTWNGNCEGCLNCYHSCPHHAINFGKSTMRKGQYTFRRHAAEMEQYIKEQAGPQETGRHSGDRLP